MYLFKWDSGSWAEFLSIQRDLQVAKIDYYVIWRGTALIIPSTGPLPPTCITDRFEWEKHCRLVGADPIDFGRDHFDSNERGQCLRVIAEAILNAKNG